MFLVTLALNFEFRFSSHVNEATVGPSATRRTVRIGVALTSTACLVKAVDFIARLLGIS
jgi:hypothetical protein